MGTSNITNIGTANGFDISALNENYTTFSTDIATKEMNFSLTIPDTSNIGFVYSDGSSYEYKLPTCDEGYDCYDNYKVYGTTLSTITNSGTDRAIESSDTVTEAIEILSVKANNLDDPTVNDPDAKLKIHLDEQTEILQTLKPQSTTLNPTTGEEYLFQKDRYLVYQARQKNGYRVILKAEKAPVFIYARAAGNQFEDISKELLLIEDNAFVELTYLNNNYRVTDSHGKISFSVFKNDAPTICPGDTHLYLDTTFMGLMVSALKETQA